MPIIRERKEKLEFDGTSEPALSKKEIDEIEEKANESLKDPSRRRQAPRASPANTFVPTATGEKVVMKGMSHGRGSSLKTSLTQIQK